MLSFSKLLAYGLILCSTAIATPLVGTTRYKANDYKSSDCSGPINYQHWGVLLYHVTMDDTTHSVYLASPNYQWVAYEAKSRDGGQCIGRRLGPLPDRCQNLDTAFPGRRVHCVAIELMIPSTFYGMI